MYFSTKELHATKENLTLAIVKSVAKKPVHEYLSINGVPLYCEISSEPIRVAKLLWLKYTVKPVATGSFTAMGHTSDVAYETESMTNIYSYIYDRLYLMA